MTPMNLPSEPSQMSVEPSTVATPQAALPKVDYARRYRKLISVYLILIAVIIGAVYAISLWLNLGSTEGMMSVIAIVAMTYVFVFASPFIVILCVCAVVTSVRYLMLNRLTGRLRMLAIVSSIAMAALVIAIVFSALMLIVSFSTAYSP